MFVERRKEMKSSELIGILKSRMPGEEIRWSFDREKDSLRIEHTGIGQGMTLGIPQVINRYKAKGDAAIDEVVYTISETFKAMELEKSGAIAGSDQIFPVIRSTSFPEESREGVRFVTMDHTAETRVYFALDIGNTYRLIDENMLNSLSLTEAQLQEMAKFQARKLSTSVKQDEVAGNIFYFLNENDGYDASRILNEAFLKEMKEKIQGDMTVSVPHQDVLIIGDIRNETGYDVLAQMAMHFFTNGKVPITSLSFVYEDGVLDPIFIMAKNRREQEEK